ncbi:hypothetical protein [Microbacterium terrisoli]|uniref:hypothetical protein n=1 Tax=Microbacterium terrisoli TaxID=3242192 RepID=UPI002805D47C|nr:hypothetical protein [Microbacterium protaetiae]
MPTAAVNESPSEAGAARTVRLRWPTACWIFILAAIGVVQVVRLQWFDAAVFVVAALGVVLAARNPGRRDRAHRLTLPTLAGAVAIFGAVLCFAPRHAAATQVVMVAAGIAAAGLAWTGVGIAQPDGQTSAGVGIRHLAWWWAAILVAGCVWELIQFILGLVQPSATWFSLSDLMNPAIATAPGKIVFVALWLSGGTWLMRRGGAR